MSGDIDGKGSYEGYPFITGGPSGFPPAAAIFRSYFEHDALEVLFFAENVDVLGSIVLDEPDVERNQLTFSVHQPQGVMWTGIDYYREAVAEAADIAARLSALQREVLDGLLLPRIGNGLEADMIVTDRTWLLERRTQPYGKHLASLVSSDEALALLGVYLRWHRLPIIHGGAPLVWAAPSMRRAAAFGLLPSFERWNQAGRRWYDLTGESEIDILNQSCLTRVARALKFRDGVYGISASTSEYDGEEMLCELDSLLFSLVGAFDVAARIVNRVLGINTKGGEAAWQKDKWNKRLESLAPELYALIKPDSSMQVLFRILRWLRNTVHYEPLSLSRSSSDGDLITIPEDAQNALRGILRAGVDGFDTDSLHIHIRSRSGAVAGKWLAGTGRHTVRVTRVGAPPDPDPLSGELMIDIRGFLNRIFPASIDALDGIMNSTPLDKCPGHVAEVDNPKRLNLPWNFSETTAQRLRLLYGLP